MHLVIATLQGTMPHITLLVYAALCCTVALSEDALHYLDKHVSDYNTELIDLVNIPSISSLPEHRDDMLSAATWLQMRLKQAGLEVIHGGIDSPL